MRLFERVPDGFFSVLSSGNRELYADVLLEIRRQVKENRIVDRETLVASLKDTFENRLEAASFDEELGDEGRSQAELDRQGLGGRVAMVLRRLEKTGWLEREQVKDSFAVNISIPDYSMIMLDALRELSKDKAGEYTRYVFPTYVLLMESREGKNPDYLYYTLLNVCENTERLLDQLLMMKHNIRRYVKSVLDKDMTVNELLRQHFDVYNIKIVREMLTPVLSTDSVRRFKTSITQALEDWLDNDAMMEAAASQGLAAKAYADEDEARRDVRDKLDRVLAAYSELPGLIDEINSKHEEYVRSSIGQIRYMSGADRSARGNLMKLLRASKDDEVARRMAGAARAFKHSWVDQASLYRRSASAAASRAGGLAIEPAPESREVVESFLEEVRSQYGNDKVDAYVMGVLGEREAVDTLDFDLGSPESFLLFLLATIRGQERSAPFRSVMESGERVPSGGRLVPMATFLRKGQEGKATRGRKAEESNGGRADV